MADPCEENEILEGLYKEAQEDFNLSVMNISEKTREVSSIKNKWLYRIVKEEAFLNKMKELQSQMISKIAAFSRNTKNSALKVKTEEFKQEELTELSEQIKKQEEAVKFLRLLLDNQVKSFTWDIRNAIEQLKLESN